MTTAADVLSLLKDKEVKFVDLRFTETPKVKSSTSPFRPTQLMTAFSKTAKCLTDLQ